LECRPRTIGRQEPGTARFSPRDARQVEVFSQLAHPVARVLRGEDPGLLPIEQPSKIELAINLGVKQQLAINVSPSLQLRDDELIE
jgi:putative ABC transport system substrate-binding protein